jgi:protein gp37
MTTALPAHLVTKIEWAHSTFNPWIGCQHVSDGCLNCYAERDNKFRRWTAGGAWGPHAERRRTSAANWRTPLRLAKHARINGERYRVFCASLSDWLDNQVPQQWRIDLAVLIETTPELDWLLLTKRIENYDRLAPWAQTPDNVWLGITGENQKEYDRRWPLLARIPATVRFVSYEPALSPLTIAGEALPDWVICGGESGHYARWMDPAWARALRDECAEKGVAFFFKQMTGKANIPDDLLVRQFPVPDRTRITTAAEHARKAAS